MVVSSIDVTTKNDRILFTVIFRYKEMRQSSLIAK